MISVDATKPQQTKKAVLAGGCFWGLEELFKKVPGVIDTEVGYTGGSNSDPSYQNHPGHAEALEITYDPTQLTYRQLLDFFFRVHDPTTLNRQGGDRGTSYRSAIFAKNDDERQQAEEMIEIVNISHRWEQPVVTSIEPLTTFHPAEDYHQDYLQKKPEGYTCHFIRGNSYLS